MFRQAILNLNPFSPQLINNISNPFCKSRPNKQNLSQIVYNRFDTGNDHASTDHRYDQSHHLTDYRNDVFTQSPYDYLTHAKCHKMDETHCSHHEYDDYKINPGF